MSTDKEIADGMIAMAAERVAADEAVEPVAVREWPVTVTLRRPIDFGKEHVASILFRDGCMGDLKGLRIDGMPTHAEAMLIASRMCGKPVAMLDKLGAEDGSEVLEIALDFFGRSLGAGRKR